MYKQEVTEQGGMEATPRSMPTSYRCYVIGGQ